MNRKWLYFLGFFFLNLLLKSIFLNYSPFSFDEIISVKDTLLDFGHIKHEAEWDNNPPFYYYCLWVWHRLIQVSEFNTRFLSVIFFSLAIGWIFLLADRFLTRKVALFSCLLLTTSNFLTYYAQESRAYALVVLLVVISSYLFLSYLENKKLWQLLLLSLVNFLVIYSHYIAGIIIPIQAAVFVMRERKLAPRFFLLQYAIISGLVFIRFTGKQFGHILSYNSGGDFWLQTATADDLISASAELFYNAPTALIVVGAHLFFIYRMVTKRDSAPDFVGLYLLLAGLGCVIILFVLGTFKAVFLSRYLIFTTVFASVLTVRQLLELQKAGLILTSLLIASQLLQLNIKKQSGMDYKSIASIVRESRDSSDVIIINKRDNLGLFLYYFDRSSFFESGNTDSVCNAYRIFGVDDVTDLSVVREHSGKVFLIQSFHKLNSSENPVKDKLVADGKLVYSTPEFKGVEFSVIARPN